jgi:hypothetical protein
MTDYWLSKMFFDLQSPSAAAEYRADPEKILSSYPISDEVRGRVLAKDVAYLAKRTNPYLLRYFFFAVGMKDDEFIAKLRHG